MKQADIGLIGLAVMGQNLVLNMNDHGFKVAVYNRTVAKVDEFLQGEAKNTAIVGAHSLKEFFAHLRRPHVVMLMVKAGQPVDEFIQLCLPYMEKGDILIDGGNSFYVDTQRRESMLREKGIFYMGMGISGGEEGARYGPSIMPGGNPAAWPIVQPIFQAISAKVENGEACCDWVGDGGAGHYVKMVHNGIEYGDMQLICESYHLLKQGLGLHNEELAEVFAKWNQGDLNSYLIEITGHIFQYKDADGRYLVDNILDVAGQKGTGKWTAIGALELGMPLTLIGEAVFARCLSSLKEERVAASKHLTGVGEQFRGNKEDMIESIRQALYASKIISYAQGYMMMKAAAKEYGWSLNYGSIALMWRGGCIIRSQFLGKIKEAFALNPHLENLLLDPYFIQQIAKSQAGWRKAVVLGAQLGIPTPCFATSLSFFDGFRAPFLPANLLQAQRDYFGAHTYERIDKPRGEFFHTNWTGSGGSVSSSSYNA